MSIPDAPWIGKCREDYYGYDDSETAWCNECGEEFDLDELTEVDGYRFCKDCYRYYKDGVERNEKLHG